MNIKEFLISFDKEEIIENLIMYFPFTTFPHLEETINYYKIGLVNIEKTEIKSSEKILTIYNDGISDRESICLKENGKIYGLILSKWTDILSMQLDKDIFNIYPKQYIASIICLDLFFNGNSFETNEHNISFITNSLIQAEKEHDKGILAEDFFEKLKSKIGEAPNIPQIGEKYKNIQDKIFEVVLVGTDLSQTNTIIALKNENNEIIMVSFDTMFKDISHIKFSNKIERKYRFEKI